MNKILEIFGAIYSMTAIILFTYSSARKGVIETIKKLLESDK